MKGIFIDSDVILDILLGRDNFQEIAVLALERCIKLKYKLYFTAVIVANIYFVARRYYGDKIVREKLLELLAHIDILDTSKSTILLSLDSNFKDFEDALQNYSAESSGKVSIVLTRNSKDYKHSNLAVVTPELFLKARF